MANRYVYNPKKSEDTQKDDTMTDAIFKYSVSGGEVRNFDTNRPISIVPKGLILFFKLHHTQKANFKKALEEVGFAVRDSLPSRKLKYRLEVSESELVEFLSSSDIQDYIEGADVSTDGGRFKYFDIRGLITKTGSMGTMAGFELDEDYSQIVTYLNAHETGKFNPAVMVAGMTGTGKTEFAYSYVEHLRSQGKEIDFIQVNPPDTIASAWMYKDALTNDKGVSISSVSLMPLARLLLVKTSVPVFVCFDEFNRGFAEGYVRPTLSMLANNNIDIDGEAHPINRPFIAYFTCNIGFGYRDINELGIAFFDRVMFWDKAPPTSEGVRNIIGLRSPYASSSDEAISASGIYKEMLTTSKKVGKPAVSPRNLLLGLQGYMSGLSWKVAMSKAILTPELDGAVDSQYRTQLEVIIDANTPK